MTPIVEHDNEVDAALVGLISLQDPLADHVDETWIATARWKAAARALLAHRRRGGTLGDLLTTADVLITTTLYLPNTTAADAILAAIDLVDVGAFVERARERAIRLRLHRATWALETIANAEIDVIPQHIARVRDDLAGIAIEADRRVRL
jgi:hypothetical protein